MTDNLCGGCTMCCKIMGVTELNKPANSWCTKCTKGVGCSVYETRPTSCVEFKCVWLQTQLGDWPVEEPAKVPTIDGLVAVMPHVQPGFENDVSNTYAKDIVRALAGPFVRALAQGAMPLEMRPDKSKVVLTATIEGGITARVDPGYPSAWREPGMRRLLDRIGQKGPVVVMIGARRIVGGRMNKQQKAVALANASGGEHGRVS